MGRSPDSVARLYDSQCSKEHCTVTCMEEGGGLSYYVEDLSSGSGTFLNSRRLTPYRSVSLYGLDQLHFGSVQAQFFTLEDYLNGNESL